MDNNDIKPQTFTAFMWNDLLKVFPADFADHAYEELETGANSVSYGDAQCTLIKGTEAERILYDAWETWDGVTEKDDVRGSYFAKLPSLINALVALNG